jgi:hypothetical protein
VVGASSVGGGTGSGIRQKNGLATFVPRCDDRLPGMGRSTVEARYRRRKLCDFYGALMDMGSRLLEGEEKGKGSMVPM